MKLSKSVLLLLLGIHRKKTFEGSMKKLGKIIISEHGTLISLGYIPSHTCFE